MTKEALLAKIETLSPEKRAEAEDFVDFLTTRKSPGTPPREAFPRELLDAINADRERLRREHGVFPDSTQAIRELREHSD